MEPESHGLRGADQIAIYWGLCHLEGLRQIVARRADVEDIASDEDLVTVVMALGYHDPTTPSEEHDDEVDTLSALREKRP
jgi:hypothetical protein